MPIGIGSSLGGSPLPGPVAMLVYEGIIAFHACVTPEEEGLDD